MKSFRLILVSLGLYLGFFSCSNPATDGGNPQPPPTYTVEVEVDTGSLVPFEIQVQARSSTESIIAGTNPSTGHYKVSGLPAGSYSIEANATVDPTSLIYYSAKADIQVDGPKKLVLTLEPSKVLPILSNPENGYWIGPGEKISLLTNTPDATIYYTLNGSVPTGTPSETNFWYDPSEQLTLTASATVRAIAYKSPLSPSEMLVASYVFASNQSQAPQFSPASGTYEDHVSVTLSGPGTIRYTTNGTDPTESSPSYSAPIDLNTVGTHTLKARSWESGKDPSSVVTAVYTISENPVQLDPPNFSQDSGTFAQAFQLTLSGPEGSTIRYTTNGNEPTGTSTIYSAPIQIAIGTTTVKAFGMQTGKLDSDIITKTYIVTDSPVPTPQPTLTPVSGTYPEGQKATISAEAGATIYYTINGDDVTVTSSTYTGPIDLAVGVTTVKARALSSGKSLSSQVEETYTIEPVSSEYHLYFKYTGAGTPEAYVWYGTPVVQPFGPWLTTAAMTSMGNGWWVADLDAKGVPVTQTVGVIFKIGDTKLSGASNLSRTGTGWCRMEGGSPVWSDVNPEQPAKPTVTLSPNGGFINTTQVVTVTINENLSAITSKTYTVNGSTLPLTAGTITLNAASLNNGDTLTLTVSATNGIGTTQSEAAVFTKSEIVNPPDTLGALYSTSATTFRIWSPDFSNVKVYLGGSNGSGGNEYTLAKRGDFAGYTDVYEVTVPGEHAQKEYQFRVNGKGVRDPYGTMVKPGTNWNIVMNMSTSATIPANSNVARPNLLNREDSIIYEVHVRDFTIDASSGVDASKRGKFLGMVQGGTRYNTTVKTGLDHLVELGVTHVQLLPFYDFGTAQYNWGYDPVNYNIPEDQYAINPNDWNGRVKELREMIKAYHAAGIRVVMDVVYNHTLSKEMFQDISSKYYTSGTGDLPDLSGCGNSIDTGVPMVSRMIQDSLEFWITEYGIDGFRFDLIGIFHYNEVRKWGEYLNGKYTDRNILLYGEPWNGYKSDPREADVVRLGKAPAMASGHIGLFNGEYRESIKGDNDKTGRGYMFNNGFGKWWASIPAGMRGSVMGAKSTSPLASNWDSMFAYDPEQSINYISAHDNFALWDKVYLSLSTNVTQSEHHQVLSLTPPTSLDYSKRVDQFGMGMILTSQGIPFIHGGDEFLRTKTNNQNMTNASDWNFGAQAGTHNTYNSPDSFNSYKWSRKSAENSTFEFYKELIALRRTSPGMRLTTWDEIKNRVVTRINAGANNASSINAVHDASLPVKVIINSIDSDGVDGADLIIVVNSDSNYTLTPPAGTWKKVFDASGAVNTSDFVCEGTAVTVFKKQ